MNQPNGHPPQFKWGIVAMEFAALFWLVALFTGTLFSRDLAPDIIPALVCVGLAAATGLAALSAFVRPVTRDQKVMAGGALLILLLPLAYMLLTAGGLY